MHITLAMVLCLAVGPVWAEDAITSDAVKAAQEPNGEFQTYQQHQIAVQASAQAWADAMSKSQAEQQEAAARMSIGTDNAPPVKGGRSGRIPFPFPDTW